MQKLLKRETAVDWFVSLGLLCIGGMCLYFFYLNIPRHIVNAATILGLIAGVVLSAAGVFEPLLKKTIKALWKKKAGKVFLCALVAAIGSGVIVYAATLSAIISAAGKTADTQTTLLVLGCQVRGSVPSPMLGDRIEAAYNYLNDNPAAKAILCGGQGTDEEISEAQCMYHILLDKGISPDRLFVEDTSSTTAENIGNAAIIIEKNRLSREVAVATSDFHQKRAATICAREGLYASAVPARTQAYLVPVYYTREVLAVVADYVRYDLFVKR